MVLWHHLSMDLSSLTPLEHQVLSGLQELARQQGLPLDATAKRLLAQTQPDSHTPAATAIDPWPVQHVGSGADRDDDVNGGLSRDELARLPFEELMARIAEARQRQPEWKPGDMTSQEAIDLVRNEMAGIQ